MKRCQFSTAQLIVHQNTELKLALAKSWGCKINGILAHDIYGSPIVESKSQQARTWKQEHSKINITSIRVVTVSHHQRDPINFGVSHRPFQ